MTKQEIIEQVAERTDMGLYDATQAVTATIQAITDAINRKEDVTLRGFGTFKVVKRGPKSVRDINNGKQYHMASRHVVRFQPGIHIQLN